MSTATGFRPVPTQPGLSAADNEAHALASYVRRPAASTASDDHAKAREPRLPQRPRGPHPQTAGA